MKTRLFVSYEEAKVLKEAGWPQKLSMGLDGVGATLYYQGVIDKAAAGPGITVRTDVEPFLVSIDSEAAKHRAVAWLAVAPRLDELLAFLLERSYRIHSGYDPGMVTEPASDSGLTVWIIMKAIAKVGGEHMGFDQKYLWSSHDPIEAAVKACLFALRYEPIPQQVPAQQ